MADVLIADDSAFVRALLRDVVGDDHAVVGEVENGVEAVEVEKDRRPDLVLMGTAMPIRDGIEATREIKAGDSGATVVLCADDGEETVTEAMEAGADEYITKPFQKQSVLDAIGSAVAP